MKNQKYILTNTEKKRIKEILKKELSRRKEIIFAYLHGAFPLPIPCGDVDIAIYLNETVPPEKYWEYEAELTMTLERLISMPVDVLTLNRAPVALRYHATRGKLLWSKNEPARFTFLEDTWREYFDCQPIFRAFLKDLLSTE
ncbi:MAG: nucleotidyltransferase domain-containing protein [Bacillota bacterium]